MDQIVYLPMTPQLSGKIIYLEEKGLYFSRYFLWVFVVVVVGGVLFVCLVFGGCNLKARYIIIIHP